MFTKGETQAKIDVRFQLAPAEMAVIPRERREGRTVNTVKRWEEKQP